MVSGCSVRVSQIEVSGFRACADWSLQCKSFAWRHLPNKKSVCMLQALACKVWELSARECCRGPRLSGLLDSITVRRNPEEKYW